MKLLVILVTGLLLIFFAPGSLQAQSRTPIERHHPRYVQKKHHTRLYKLLHGRRDRHLRWYSGHTEFKDRTKRDRRRLSRHHIKPTPESEYRKVVKKSTLKDKSKEKDAAPADENAPKEKDQDKTKEKEQDKPKEVQPETPATPQPEAPQEPKPEEKK